MKTVINHNCVIKSSLNCALLDLFVLFLRCEYKLKKTHIYHENSY